MDMATSAIRVPLEDYFRLAIRPACEYIDGELRQKPMGTREHMLIELRLVELLRRYANLGEAIHELSIRFADNSVLIPDVVVTWPDQAYEEHGVLQGPPRLCIEILSPFQRARELFEKCREFHARGVAMCWVIDPVGRRAWECAAGESEHEIAADDSLRAGEIEIRLEELFA
jgi:Uma2 family endonuclease